MKTRIFFIVSFLLIAFLLALSNKFSAYVVISLSLFFFSFIAWDAILSFNHILLNGTVTKGTIKGYKSYEEGDRAIICYLSDEGKQYTGEATFTFAPGINSNTYPVGSVVEIVYNVDKPKQFVYFLDGVTTLARIVAIILTIGSVIAFFKHFDN